MASIRIFNQNVPSTIVVLAVIELLLFIASLYGGVYLRFWGEGIGVIEQHTGFPPLRAGIFAVVMMSSMLALGLYRRTHIADRRGMTSVFPRIAISHLIGLLLIAAIFYILPDLHIYRGVYLIAALLALIATTIARMLFLKFANHQVFKRRVLVYGAGKHALEIDRLEQQHAGRAMFNVLHYVRCGKSSDDPLLNNAIEKPTALLPFCQLHGIDEIVIATDDRRNNLPTEELMDCKMNGINVTNIAAFFERQTGALRIDLLRPDSFIFSDGFKVSTLRSATKRIIDILAALAILPLALLALPITVLCIWWEDGWEAKLLYWQQRIGAGGKPFNILKMRSMDVDDKATPQFAGEDDPRITRVGKFIRQSRIDELPQLLNVLRGDMSFVGPRPEQPEFVEKFSDQINYYKERHTVKPGITGWAQVKYTYTDDNIEQTTIKLQYDLYYVKNYSLFFDLFILIHTVEIVLLKLGPR